ncbi:MAG: M28 family peptidase [Saprospiraceae bacterium]|nr:M28 family peptidase [Saprospiraceae bacterium]
MTVDLLTLSSDEMEGRETGKAGEKLAAEYIENRFSSLGLRPKGDNNTFFQTFKKKLKAHPHAEISESDPEISGRNVIGYIDNKKPYTVVIGAHYDHLGYGEGGGSLHAGEKAIHNGADDNASGVTGLIYLAEALQKKEYANNNYLFIAFSGEEKGLLGSNFFINNPTVDKNSINYMINMDMIGRLGKRKYFTDWRRWHFCPV